MAASQERGKQLGNDDCFADHFKEEYSIVKEAEIRRRMEDSIAKVSNGLSVSKFEATILLVHYKWNVKNVVDAWSGDEKEARKKAGLPVKPLCELPDLGDVFCGICLEYHPVDGIKSIKCGHPFCDDCWSRYIKMAIAEEGPGSLLLKCPMPFCGAAVGEDLVILFASEQEKKMYSRYVLRSYVEENKKTIKWCPGRGCENAINCFGGSENFDVTCLCSHSFCWNCLQEAHRPLDCETAMEWMLMNNSEVENTLKYMKVCTKPCPKCKSPIQKDGGCPHMVCSCKFEFCWLCESDLDVHEDCEDLEGIIERERLEKENKCGNYMHYSQLWVTDKRLMESAAAELQRAQSEQIKTIGSNQLEAEVHLSFLTEAWKEIVECRRVLAWTCAYGYYLPDEDVAKINFLEDLQDQAESILRRLQDCVEQEVLPFLEKRQPMKCLIEYREKVSGLTKDTRNYFRFMVGVLQKNRPSVVSSLDPSKKPRTVNQAAGAGAASTSAAASLELHDSTHNIKD